MQRHRQRGVTYSAVTFRRDGGWKHSELFTARGLGVSSPGVAVWRGGRSLLDSRTLELGSARSLTSG